jgi:uncharacterized protein
MFREGGLLLREEPSISDISPYASVLGAISAGNTRRNEIAAVLGRPASSIAYLLTGLQDIGLIEHLDDALRAKRSTFRVTEPVVRLHQLVTSRYEPELVAGRADRVWARAAHTVDSKIYGPHFEDLARQWCLYHATEETMGGIVGAVWPTEIACREHRGGHQVDIVAIEDPGAGDRITAIGEAKDTNAPVDIRQLRRLEHLRGMLPASRIEQLPKLLLFSRMGFTPDLADESVRRPDIELVGLDRLYRGD